MKVKKIELGDGHCQECYKEFEKGDAVGFVLKEYTYPDEPNSFKIALVHMRHLVRHSHRETTVYES